MYRKIICTLLAVALLLGAVGTVQAGGWSSVTLDKVPGTIYAEEPVALGFTVRQHGVTPIMLEGTPSLVIQNSADGEEFVFEAHPGGDLGHYDVEVSFPSDGEWKWRADIAPFPSVDLGSIVVEQNVATEGEATRTGLYASLVILTLGLALVFWRGSIRTEEPGGESKIRIETGISASE